MLLMAARKGNLITFPGITPENISKHFPESDETTKGHMKQVKEGVRSTKVIDEDAMLDSNPTPGGKHKDVYLRLSLMQPRKPCTQTKLESSQ